MKSHLAFYLTLLSVSGHLIAAQRVLVTTAPPNTVAPTTAQSQNVAGPIQPPMPVEQHPPQENGSNEMSSEEHGDHHGHHAFFHKLLPQLLMALHNKGNVEVKVKHTEFSLKAGGAASNDDHMMGEHGEKPWHVCDPALTDKNIKMVVEIENQLFGQKITKNIDQYFAKDAIEHNPNVKGIHDLVPLIESPAGAQLSHKWGGVIGRCELVMTYRRYTGLGPNPQVAVDIFRVKEGKIVEHWDILQDERAQTASGAPHFAPFFKSVDAAMSQPNLVDGAMCDPAVTEKNLNLVKASRAQLFDQHNFTGLDAYYAPNYVDHNPDTKDLNTIIGFIKSKGDALGYEIGGMFAQCEIVMGYGRRTIKVAENEFVKHVGVDIWRVKDGKIVEHWDVLQPEKTPPTASGAQQYQPFFPVKQEAPKPMAG